MDREKMPDIGSLTSLVHEEDCFKKLHNTKTAKQTIRKVISDWSNYFKSLKAYNKNPKLFKKRPNHPGYKRKVSQVIFYNETIRIGPRKDGYLTPTNDVFKIKSNKDFCQVVVTPKRFGFIIEVQYEVETPVKSKAKREGIACVDLGLNNLMAITSDQFSPILVNGRILKSINQWFNKNKCKNTSRKRYWRIENYFHHAANFLIELCINHKVGTIIIGKNDGWKEGMNIGKKNTQNFQYVPFGKLLQKIEYKAQTVGIAVIYTEESYTSQASFANKDPLPIWEKGMDTPFFSGKRTKRGLYKNSDGSCVNADINGSLNIGRKVLDKDVIGNVDYINKLNRSLAARPLVINPLKDRCGQLSYLYNSD
jgi:putative transposase